MTRHLTTDPRISAHLALLPADPRLDELAVTYEAAATHLTALQRDEFVVDLDLDEVRSQMVDATGKDWQTLRDRRDQLVMRKDHLPGDVEIAQARHDAALAAWATRVIGIAKQEADAAHAALRTTMREWGHLRNARPSGDRLARERVRALGEERRALEGRQATMRRLAEAVQRERKRALPAPVYPVPWWQVTAREDLRVRVIHTADTSASGATVANLSDLPSLAQINGQRSGLRVTYAQE